MLYFAYGSNLYRSQMEERCPESKPFCRALLTDFCPSFTYKSERWGGGVLDIRPAPGDIVWGMVYDISEQDLESLNRFENYRGPGKRNSYNLITVTVFKEGLRNEPIPGVLTYQVAYPDHNYVPPSQEYLRRILIGAQKWELPGEYRKRLEQFKLKDVIG
jgi:gamma-glutamylcyclotransferase